MILVAGLLSSSAIAHDPLLDLPEPKSVPEAWDVIRQSVDNVGKLLETNQLKPIAFHIANCSPAVRRLQADLGDRPDREELYQKLQEMFAVGGQVIVATRQKESSLETAREQYKQYSSRWDEIAARYPREMRHSAVFNCPMHPLDRHLKETDRCTICSMKLNRRRIPSSTTYERPGAASMTLTLVADPPLKPGVKSTVKANLARLDGSPVAPADLLVMHTERVHLLIVDSSLSDYHHEHPTPTQIPGEYQFSITPRLPGEYRVFADLVLGATGVQEYVSGDVPAAPDNCHGNEITDKANRLTAEDRGIRASLIFPDLKGKPPRPREVVTGELRFADSDGRSYDKLEPVMAAFAHIVGFSEDRKTVVHLHPQGEEPDRPELRGGPMLRFNFYAPVAGYYRMYVQVAVGGENRFIPLGVNVVESPPRK